MLQIRATIVREPDAATGGLIFGPRVLISAEALAATGLIRPGALVTYHYRLRLPPGVDAAAWANSARAAFPEAGWQIRTFGEASPSLQRLIDRVALFLSLVGLTALLVGGVGIGNAVGNYIAGKTATIATLKCLGASNRLVFAAYLFEVLGLAVLGIAVALLVGALAPIAAAPLLSGVLPVSIRFAIHPAPLALAALFGLLTTLVFSLWPLAGIGRISAAALFRDTVDRARRRIPPGIIGATAVLALGLAALAVVTAQDRNVALWFVAGVIAAFALFRATGAAILWVARRLGRPRRPVLRLALANLHRPGAPTAQIVLSLGIGLTVLVAVALVEANLSHEVETKVPAEAPAFFFIDIQPDQLAGFDALVRATPGARFDQVPMMRGRITRLNGVPVEDAAVAPEAQWALRSDRGLTYAASLPQGSRLAAGAWWPPDYQGPPLVSFDAALARGMGLKVGDTLTVNLLGREITAHDRQSALDRLGAARHQLCHGVCAGNARACAADPSRSRLSAAGRGGKPGARGDRALPQHLGDSCPRGARRGQSHHRHDRECGSPDCAGDGRRRGARPWRRSRSRTSTPGLRCRRAQGVGRNARRDHAGFSDRERDYRRARRRWWPAPSAPLPPISW